MKPSILAAVFTLCVFGAGTLQAQTTRSFGTATRIAITSEAKLSRIQRNSFRDYRSKKSYFGAYYIVEGTDHGFWTRNFHDFDIAQAAAKKGCEIISKGGNCTLYALIYPDGVAPDDKAVKGISRVALKDLRGRYIRKQKKGTYGAFAINRAYGYGMSFGWDNEAEARAAALSFCEADSAVALAPLGIEGRKWAARRGLETCTVIDLHRP